MTLFADGCYLDFTISHGEIVMLINNTIHFNTYFGVIA